MNMKVVDFFCGAGGFSEGFRRAGFDVVVAVDNWQYAVKTHHANHPNTKVIKDDVERMSNLHDKEFNELIPDSEIIIGSPPCVAFSNSNRSGKANKDYGKLLFEAYLRIIARKKFKKNSILKYWILENVPNVERYLQESYSAQDLGLTGDFNLKVKSISSKVYNAKYFGVPSNRKRYFCGDFPEPVLIKMEESLIHLSEVLSCLNEPRTGLNTIMNDPNYNNSMLLKDVTDHHYLHKIADFELEKAKRAKQDKGYMGRMSFPENEDKPARTIMATMSFSSRESMIFRSKKHGYRAPTIREISSLMSFPIDYRFYGNSLLSKYRLVGNAVPPKMSYAFAKAIAVNENVKHKVAYTPIEKYPKNGFYNLNSVKEISENVEKPKKHNARFKYHIPYLLSDAYRVELTNHHSLFDKNKYIWSVEIHKSQGKNAKIFCPRINKDVIELEMKKKIDKFCKDIYPKLNSFAKFQRAYCMTSRERGKKIGPFELLYKIREFVDSYCKKDNEAYIACKGAPYSLPSKIAIGYYVLCLLIKEMKQMKEE